MHYRVRSALITITARALLGRGAALAVALFPTLALAAPPVFFGLGDLPNHSGSYPFALSSDGKVIVGDSAIGGATEAFIFTQEDGIQSLGDLPGGDLYSTARGISPDGSVIVGWSASAKGPQQACKWKDGQIIGLDDLDGDGFSGGALGASAGGSIIVGVGNSDLGNEGVVWINDIPTRIGGFPEMEFATSAVVVSQDGSVIFGSWTHGSGTYRWVNGVVDDLGGSAADEGPVGVRAASADGSVAVGEFMHGGRQEACRWEAGRAESLEPIGSLSRRSMAFGVSADGSVVVGDREGQDPDWSGPFLWDRKHGMRSLMSILQRDFPTNVTDWILYSGRGISADATTIVGTGGISGGQGGAWAVIFSDSDEDGLLDYVDNCPGVANSEQADKDSDGAGDACDNCLDVANGPLSPDAGGHTQRDTDHDGYGNVCDADLNNDGIVNFIDLARMKARFFSTNATADVNGDGAVNFADLAIMKQSFFKKPGPAAGKP